MNGATIEEARAAKVTLRAQLLGLPELRGIGVAFLDDGCAVKVLLRELPVGVTIPPEVDGVPVIVEIVDELTPL